MRVSADWLYFSPECQQAHHFAVNVMLRILSLMLSMLLASSAFAHPAFAQSPADTIRTILAAPDDELSYEHSKLTIDRIIAPTLDGAAVAAQIDQLATSARRIAAGGNDIDKLKAVRQVIYDAGAWNGSRPFVYDHADPFGRDLRNKLLATYLDADIAAYRGREAGIDRLEKVVRQRSNSGHE